MKNTGAEIRNKKMLSINHYLIGFGLIVKGIEKSEHFSNHPLSVVFFFAAGAAIIAGTFFHHRIENKFKKFDSLFFLLEGSALFLAGLILYEKGGSKIPYFLFFLALVYTILGAASLYANEQNKEEVFTRIGKILGSMFILAGIAALIVNIIWFNSFWMYLISIVLAVMGFIQIKLKVLLKKYNIK